MLTDTSRWSHARGNEVVPSRWQATALAETVNGYYKAELIRGPAREGRPWKTVEDAELATLSWVHWHNHDRLPGCLADAPPAEFEETFYATKRTDQLLAGIQ